jgi:hypothetical protein
MLKTNKQDDSSDDEFARDGFEGKFDMDSAIRGGGRGIVTFNAYCVKTDTTKMFYINLYSNLIYQYNYKGERKVTACRDVQSITIRPDHNVIVEIKRKSRADVLNFRQKKFIFSTDEGE